MSSGPVVISVENLSKSYQISHKAASGETFREMLGRQVRGMARGSVGRRQAHPHDEVEEFWALRDISFEVRQGEVMGVIGRNGAGKSTLLKVLSRITAPTAGRVTLSGRVASLLEVGTGFHPELTGRENIYLNGAILGMSRSEIASKFDEIVSFSEVERFLDTPVKRYSSGMYVRLSFAVAAHLDQEILIVDEVLAVGDAEFQKKCLGKMQDVAEGGRTVLFVSHNLEAIASLCPRTIELADGQVISDGATSEVIERYLSKLIDKKPGASNGRRIDQSLTTASLEPSNKVCRSGDSCEITINFVATEPGTLLECAILIYTMTGVRIAIYDLRLCGIMPIRYQAGTFSITAMIKSLPFIEGHYSLGLWVTTLRNGENLLDLSDIMIVSRATLGSVSYPANVRGYVELDADAHFILD